MVVLDTDHMTMLEWKSRPETQRLRARLNELSEDEVATTIISYEEQIRGWMAYLAKSRTSDQRVKAYRRLRNQLHNYCEIIVLDFGNCGNSLRPSQTNSPAHWHEGSANCLHCRDSGRCLVNKEFGAFPEYTGFDRRRLDRVDN